MKPFLGLFPAALLIAISSLSASETADHKQEPVTSFEICGIAAHNIIELRKSVEEKSDIIKLSEFDVYAHFMTKNSEVLVFATPLSNAYPSVACRYYTEDQAKPENLVVDVRCETSQENCDRFYTMIGGTRLTMGPDNSESNP